MQPSDHPGYVLLYNEVVDWFVPDSLREAGGVHELRARLVPIFTVGLVALGLVFCFLYGFTLEMPSAAWAITIGIILVSFAPVSMRWVDRYEPASKWISLNFYWVVLVLTLFTGGLESPALRWMAIVPVYVLLFCGIRPALGWVALVTVTYTAFYVFPALGYPVPQRLSAADLQLLRLVGMLGLTMLVLELFVFHGWLVDSLQDAREKLQQEDERKNKFLAMLGHELRNPFTSIANGLAILDRVSLPKTADRQVEIMRRQTTALERMLDDLLDIARITRENFELRRESVDLIDSLESALSTTEAQFPESERDVRRRFLSDRVRVYGDPVRLEQIFGDLLNNAFKYTDTDGTVWITVDPDDPYARVSIRDDGRGMSDEELDRVFEMFDRGTSETYDAAGGLGIGLTVAKRLTELHGGRLEAHSAGPDQGSEFVVYLPVSEHVAGETEPSSTGD